MRKEKQKGINVDAVIYDEFKKKVKSSGRTVVFVVEKFMIEFINNEEK